MNSLTVIICFWFVSQATAFAATSGTPPFMEKKCISCHRFSAETAKDAATGPDLLYAGDKFQKAWLVAYLQKPEIIRKAGYTTDPGFLRGESSVQHIALSPEEAKVAANYLLTLKLPATDGKVDNEPLSKGNRARIKVLFERDYGCSACHETINLAGKVHGGISGPSLIDAGNRLTADWVSQWLKSPKMFLDKGRMPVFQLEDDMIVRIAKYLMTMKKENLK